MVQEVIGINLSAKELQRKEILKISVELKRIITFTKE